MELHCTRPGCSRPHNSFPDLDSNQTIKSVGQKFCTTCGMQLVLAGRYLPQKLLGRGGFGAAYLAVDRFSPALRTCVVKIFQPDGDLEPAQLQLAQGLFEREAEALEQLGNAHPQIPDLLAFFPLEVPSLQPGKTQELFYLVQEFIDGQSLEEELQQEGPLAEQDVQAILLDILGVLQFVHDRDTIHRDIKPSNIMRDRQGKIYLLDFGAVKQVTRSAGRPIHSSTGIYSPGYAPPEQMQGGAVYPSTDLYALAVTALVLLTGKEPTDLYDSFSGAWQYQNFLTIGDGFAEVLEKMLQQAPRDRLQSAEAVQQALQSITRSPSQGTAGPTSSSPQSQAPHSSTSLQASPPQPSPTVSPSPIFSSSPQSKQAPTSPQNPASPSPPLAPSPSSSHSVKAVRPPLSLPTLLGHAAFTGGQAGALGIAIASFLGTTLVGTGSWLLILGTIITLQYLRVIEGIDLIIISALSLLVLAVARPLTAILAYNLINVLLLVAVTGLIAMAVTLLFQILFRLLRNLL